MKTETHEVIQLELKYCERCGGLWLRRKDSDKVYCASCATEVPEFPIRRRANGKARLPGSVRKSAMQARFEVIRGRGGRP
jgi:Zn-finger nucleic acid-binding protein